MSVLPDWMIRNYSQSGLISPFVEEQLQPASYDVRLADALLVPAASSQVLDPTEENAGAFEKAELGSAGFVLDPGMFVLGSTVEYVRIPPTMVGRIEGKSSLARIGSQIESAGYLDPGFGGNITVELINFLPRPVLLRADMLIAQLSFSFLKAPCERPYSARRNHYQGSRGVVASRYVR